MAKLVYAISGSSGLVGYALCEALIQQGHQVKRIVRHSSNRDNSEIHWDLQKQSIEIEKLSDVDCVVHLAGESIASGWWTASKKKAIAESRILSTRLIAGALAKIADPNKTLISASAIGYYGDRAAEPCDEDTSPGTNFLSKVSVDWESETKIAAAAGIRVAIPRIGIVISAKGGALAKMLLPFKLGLGGRLGSGHQYMSWLSLNDLVRIICFLSTEKTAHGLFNAVAPLPVTNAEFTRTLAAFLHKPAFLHVPAFMLKLLLGQFAEEALLSSTLAECKALDKLDFKFEERTLEQALIKAL